MELQADMHKVHVDVEHAAGCAADEVESLKAGDAPLLGPLGRLDPVDGQLVARYDEATDIFVSLHDEVLCLGQLQVGAFCVPQHLAGRAASPRAPRMLPWTEQSLSGCGGSGRTSSASQSP